ncbi:MAG: hypothetical protein HY821_02540 [Acidobacteria bacterium]|nr:hypothetical protein [Acidobacteriota bacterium]
MPGEEVKKPKPIEIHEDAALKARRRARVSVGAVKPSFAITPKAAKPPKHKKKAAEADEG